MEKVYNIFFSPTGGTRRVAEAVTNRASVSLMLPIYTINVTDPSEREKFYEFDESDVVIVAAPTYAGKLPNKLLYFFREHIRGTATRAIAAVTYGNRSFDNSLAELIDCLKKNGFKVESAGAFVTKHAFSNCLASDRPSKKDLEEAAHLADCMVESFVKNSDYASLSDVPGKADADYYVPKGEDGNPVNFLKAKPVTDSSLCINCGICKNSCPMAAIDREDVTNIPGTCIKCQACVTVCPKDAKYFDDEGFISHKKMLEKNFRDKKDNYLYVH